MKQAPFSVVYVGITDRSVKAKDFQTPRKAFDFFYKRFRDARQQPQITSYTGEMIGSFAYSELPWYYNTRHSSQDNYEDAYQFFLRATDIDEGKYPGKAPVRKPAAGRSRK